jgi:hypothetical protein
MAEAPNKWQRWTDTEDSVVDLFPAREAAELLGRTYQAVRSRRERQWSVKSGQGSTSCTTSFDGDDDRHFFVALVTYEFSSLYLEMSCEVTNRHFAHLNGIG